MGAATLVPFKGAVFDFGFVPDFFMRNRLQRLYGRGDLHFVTFSCYRRRPFLGTPRARHRCVKILEEGRNPADTLTETETSTPAPLKFKGMRHPARELLK